MAGDMVAEAVIRGPTAAAAVGDAELVARARSGDADAFEALLAARLPGLGRFAMAVVGNEQDARDAVQQACVQAWRELPALRGVDRFDAWLGRILSNACRRSLRTRRRRWVREIAVTDLDTTSSSALRTQATASPSERAVAMDALSRAFDRIDPEARLLLALHHLEGLPVSDLAARMGLTPPTVKWRLHMARAALQRALEAEDR